MVELSFMVKGKLGKKLLPCRAPGCEISTNKRYSGPGGKIYTACMFKHAETARAGQ